MGAWGTGNFENDDALDFVVTVADSSDLQPVEAAFDAVLSAEDDYIDSYVACEALAAGEVVALLHGKPAPNLPEELIAWQQQHSLTVDDALRQKARQAIDKATADAETSELRELWEEEDNVVDEWYAHVTDLLARLQ